MSKWSCLFIHSFVFELTNGNIVWGKRNPLELSENSNNGDPNCRTNFQCKKCGLLRKGGKGGILFEYLRIKRIFDL